MNLVDVFALLVQSDVPLRVRAMAIHQVQVLPHSISFGIGVKVTLILPNLYPHPGSLAAAGGATDDTLSCMIVPMP
ncbi:MAG: hypothetical protein JWN14_3581 [Chthonomonadales bacterium]|nr:hypothetical protein [Chthonomonadales bacterium]